MNNIFKKGFYIMAVLFLGIATSCEEDDNGINIIEGLDFNIATLNVEGTEAGVIASTVGSDNRIVYTVDFGNPDDTEDVFPTSGPMVTYTYPEVEESVTYIITVTAALAGKDDVSISKDHTVIYTPPVVVPVIPGGDDPLAGTWRLAPEAGSIGVGPALNDVSWWSIPAGDIATRACIYDDEYVFGADGSFQNVLGSETWLEAWQGTDPEACGTPVFPHDGTATATYTYDETAGTITIDGKGAFLGLAKVVNGAEIGNPADAADSITYIAAVDGNTMELDIEIAGGGHWSFKLVRDAAPSIVGTWRLAPEAGSIGVGPAKDDVSWWSIPSGDIATRSCIYDDDYIFNEDGSFQNVLGSETWLEAWQGTDPEACGTPVFPHDGTASATYTYDATAETITIDGKGAFLGLAKVINGAEIGNPADAADSITYIAVLDGDTLDIDIEIAGGGYWTFKLARQ